MLVRDIVLFNPTKEEREAGIYSLEELKKKKKAVEGSLKEIKGYKNKKILCIPMLYSIEEGAIKELSKGKAVVVINIRKLYKTKGKERSKEIARLSTFIMLCNIYSIKCFVASFAKSREEQRTIDEKRFIAELLGIKKELSLREVEL